MHCDDGIMEACVTGFIDVVAAMTSSAKTELEGVYMAKDVAERCFRVSPSRLEIASLLVIN